MESVAVGMALVGVDGRTDLRVLHDRAHDIVGAAHPKAKPVILRTGEKQAGQRMSQAIEIAKAARRGGAEGNRTPDLIIANDALSQLSYSPVRSAAAS